MPPLSKFDPPAFMDDLDRIPGGAEAWDTFMDTVFDWAIKQQHDIVVPAEPGGAARQRAAAPFSPAGREAEPWAVSAAYSTSFLSRSAMTTG